MEGGVKLQLPVHPIRDQNCDILTNHSSPVQPPASHAARPVTRHEPGPRLASSSSSSIIIIIIVMIIIIVIITITHLAPLEQHDGGGVDGLQLRHRVVVVAAVLCSVYYFVREYASPV